jgi:preprotein translocase subunit SecG
MTTLITALHVTVCILLILIVLLQSGKGAGMGLSMGGGGSQTLFGAAGPATILTKITTVIAIVFMVTSLTLAYFSGHKAEKSIITTPPAPVEQTTDTGTD